MVGNNDIIGSWFAWRRVRSTRLARIAAAFLTLAGAGSEPALAQQAPPEDPISRLKQLSIEELMDIEVTSVSKRPEKLAESASAIQVIGGEDIRRSGATSLPEALRLAPNLRVAQVNSYGWVVSARGFSALFANKLLVLVDGRTVYTPLFAGVLWDVQTVPLAEIDRVEVISGPAGTLWGANAVNGVINVVTKPARETPGLRVEAGGGSMLERFAAFRYGGSAGDRLHYRVHAARFERDRSELADGRAGTDAWEMDSGGFRADWEAETGTLTVQGDLYGGTEHTSPADSTLRGGNLLGRWTHRGSPDSDWKVQWYYDRTWRRDVPSTLTDRLETWDVEFQHSVRPADNHALLWGAGVRRMRSEVGNATSFVGFVPPRRDLDLFNAFAQDEIALAGGRTRLTVGAKVEHNDFSGFEVQPGVRLAWTPAEHRTFWGAVSRAVRSPSRIDRDYHIPAFDIQPGSPGVDGGPNFDSEKLLAFELGCRMQPDERGSVSLAVFYNRYDDLYTVEPFPAVPTYQIQNGAEGESWGAEFSGTWQPAAWWRLRGGVTWFRKDIRNKPGHSSDNSPLGNDPEHQWLLQSMIDLPSGFELDATLRAVGPLPRPAIPGHAVCDVRLAWRSAHWELSVTGQNLGDRRHPEFGTQQIPRSVWGKVAFQW